MMALKGVHHAIHSGMLAAEAIYESLKAGKATTPAGLWGYTRRIRDSSIWKDLWKVRNIRPAFQKGFLYGGMVHGMATGLDAATRRASGSGPRPTPRSRSSSATAAATLPEARRRSTSSTSSRASSRAATPTRDDQPSHIRMQHQGAPRARDGLGAACARRKVYEIDEDAPQNGTVTVKVNASNCVQCGAITAKGGRLTPPEGGSGPGVHDHLTHPGP